MSLLDRALLKVGSHARGPGGACWASEATLRRELGERGPLPGERSIGRVLRREAKREGTTLRGRIVAAGERLPNGWRSTRRRKVYWFETRAQARRSKTAARRAARQAADRERAELREAELRSARRAARAGDQRERARDVVAFDPTRSFDAIRAAAAARTPNVAVAPPAPADAQPEKSNPPDSSGRFAPVEEEAERRRLIEAGDWAALAALTRRERPPPR